MFKRFLKVLSLTALSSVMLCSLSSNELKTESEAVVENNDSIVKRASSTFAYFDTIDTPNWCSTSETLTSTGVSVNLVVDSDWLGGTDSDSSLVFVHFSYLVVGHEYNIVSPISSHEFNDGGFITGALIDGYVNQACWYDVINSNVGDLYCDLTSGTECLFGNMGSSKNYNYTFSAKSSDITLVLQGTDLIGGDYQNIKIDMYDLDGDTLAPVVSTSQYTMSLPVGTSTRITKDYLLNQKIFSVIDETDGDITNRLVIESNNINYNTTGTYKVVCSWTDDGGNKATCTLNVVVGDFTKPTYSISNSTIYVEAPNTISNDDLLANVSFNDNYSSVTKSIVTNGYNQTTALGTYSVTIRGTDTSGNYSDATFNVVVRDITKPIVTGIVSDSWYKSGIITCSDSGSGIKSVTIDGKSISLSNGSYTFDSSNCSDGSHTLVVTDNANNSTTISFNVDNSLPYFDYEPDWVNSGDYGVYDDVSGLASITINDIPYVINSDGSFAFDVANFSDGTYVVVATDKSGNSTSTTYKIDKTAPSISGLTSGSVINNATISFSDSSSGISGVTIDGKAVTLSNGKYTFNASNYSDGSHTLVVTDNALNKTSVSFISDKTAPVVSGVINGSRYNSDINLSISDTYSNIAEYYLNDSLVSVTSGKTYSCTLNASNLKQGTNIISGLKDSLGNTIASNITFVYDTISPEISGGQSIESGEYLTADKVKAQFTATDNVDGNVSIEVVSSDIVDKVGTYSVVLKATDKTGNSKQISVSVTRLDVVAPVIFIQSSDEVKIIRVSNGTELTYENLLNIFMYLYQDVADVSEVQCLSDSFVASGTEARSVRYMATNRVTGEVNLYKLDFESYSLISDVTEPEEPENPSDVTEPEEPENPSDVTEPEEPENPSDVTKPDDSSDKEKIGFWQKIGNWFKNIFSKIWNTIKSWFSSDDETKDSSNVEIVETSKSNKEEVESDNAKFVLE